MKNRSQGSALRLATLVFAAAIVAIPSHAQDAASPKFTMFGGAGMLATQGHANGEFQAGGAIEETPPNSQGGLAVEGGYLGPWSRLKAGSAFVSVNYTASWALGPSGKGSTANGKTYWSDRGWKWIPFVTGGYTRLFGTGNAVNFGGGIDYRPDRRHAIRFEVRDYYAPASPSQHNIAFRIGWVSYIQD